MKMLTLHYTKSSELFVMQYIAAANAEKCHALKLLYV